MDWSTDNWGEKSIVLPFRIVVFLSVSIKIPASESVDRKGFGDFFPKFCKNWDR
jgi:hypothetical protein